MPAGHDISYVDRTGPPAVYYDESTFTLNDTGFFTQFFRLIVSGFSRASLAATARIVLTDSPMDPSTLRFRSPTSSTVNPDEYVIRHNRVIYNGNVRETIAGTGRSILIDDLSPRPGRLILSGAGGGN